MPSKRPGAAQVPHKPGGGSSRLRRLTRGWPFSIVAGAAALALLAASIWRRPFVNEDGALYLMIARRIESEGLASGLSLFDSPVYSALIAAAHALTGYSMRQSAYVLSALFVVMIALAFTDICRRIYAEQSIAPWAALVLLAHPKLNNYFSFIVRDIGYWALLLGSWSLFLRHLQDARTRWLGGWSVLALMAATFKPEGLAFGLVLPLAILCDGRTLRSRLLRLTIAYTLLLLVPLAAIMLQREVPIGQVLCCLHERPLAALLTIPQNFLAASQNYASHVLDPDSSNLAALSLAGGLLVLLVAKVLNTFGVLQILLLVAGWRNHALSPAPAYRAAYGLLLVTALALPAAFLAGRLFLDTRYLMIACFLLLMPAARALQMLALRRRNRVHAVCMMLLLVALAGDFTLGLDKSKPYMLDAYAWIREHAAASPRVFTNDRQIAAVALGNEWDLHAVETATPMIESRQVPMMPGTLWVVHVLPAQAALKESLRVLEYRLMPLATFEDGRGASVRIYRETLPVTGP